MALFYIILGYLWVYSEKKHKNIEFQEEQGGKTPVRFNKKQTRLTDVEKKARHKKRKRIAIWVTSLVVVLLLAFFGWKAWNAIRDVFENDGGILNLLTGQTQNLKGESEGRTNILLLGVGDESHTASTLSDSMILASIDYKSGYVAMFSIPRDAYVKIPGNGYSKINAAHAYGERLGKGRGPELAKRTVEENFGVPIHYYARVDFSGLQKMVDALGGITVEVENSFCDYSYPVGRKGDTRKVCFTKGRQTMNGTKALQYSRSRHAYGVEGSDFARSRRQQKVILAIKEKALSANTVFNPKKVIDVMSVLGDHIKTDFEAQDFARLYELSKEIEQSKVISKNFDNTVEGMFISASSYQTGYILRPRAGDYEEIKRVVRNIFSVVYVREEKASISIQNGTWTSGLAYKLADSMKKDGYNVVEYSNAANRNTRMTQIIDYSDGKKSATVQALEERFGVKAVKSTTGEQPGYDIKILIGRNYRG